MSKEIIVNQIRQRILDEHRKHEGQDWAGIAAYKIYVSHIGTKFYCWDEEALGTRCNSLCQTCESSAMNAHMSILGPEADKQIREEVQKIALDVMNLGMSLRQDQLKGWTDKSGNEILKEYMDGL